MWLVFCVLASIFQAGFSETNSVYKIDAYRLNLLHAFFAILVLLPLLAICVWPQALSFYVYAILSGFIIGFGCAMQLSIASKHNGRVSSMYIPLEAFVAFTLWAMLYPLVLSNIFESWLSIIGLVLSFAICAASLLYIRKNRLGFSNFLLVVPIGIGYGINAVFAKLALIDHDVFATISYVLINYIVMFFVMVLVCFTKNKVSFLRT